MPTTTTNYAFTKPDTGQPNWGGTMNATLDSIDAAITSAAASGGGGNQGGATFHVVASTDGSGPEINVGDAATHIFSMVGSSVGPATITNPLNGLLTFVVLQDATGGWTFTFPTNFRGAGSISASSGTAAAHSYAAQTFVYVSNANLYVAVAPLLYGE